MRDLEFFSSFLNTEAVGLLVVHDLRQGESILQVYRIREVQNALYIYIYIVLFYYALSTNSIVLFHCLASHRLPSILSRMWMISAQRYFSFIYVGFLNFR